MNRWRAVMYNEHAWVFIGGALLDRGVTRFAIVGGIQRAEELAELLNRSEAASSDTAPR